MKIFHYLFMVSLLLIEAWVIFLPAGKWEFGIGIVIGYIGTWHLDILIEEYEK